MSTSDIIVSCIPIELIFTYYLVTGILSMHLADMPIQKIANFFGLNVKALFDKGPLTMSITNSSKKRSSEDDYYLPRDTHLSVVYLCFWEI
jgi:hypothetical protein